MYKRILICMTIRIIRAELGEITLASHDMFGRPEAPARWCNGFVAFLLGLFVRTEEYRAINLSLVTFVDNTIRYFDINQRRRVWSSVGYINDDLRMRCKQKWRTP